MTDSTEICKNQQLTNKDDFYDLFAELEELEPFDIKKEELAAQLAALLSHSGKTRTEFASLSDWKKSRVSNILNGQGNPTFKTLWEFARYLGYEADLHFRLPDEAPAKQPWYRIERKLQSVNFSGSSQYLPLIEIQSADEVANDMKNGKHKDVYLSISTIELTQVNKITLINDSLNSLPLTTTKTRELACL